MLKSGDSHVLENRPRVNCMTLYEKSVVARLVISLMLLSAKRCYDVVAMLGSLQLMPFCLD